MKKLISFLISVVLLTSTVGAVDLYVDMEKIETDTPPTIVDGRTLVPLRAIFESIGATVEWDNTSRTATGVRGNTTVSIQIDNTTAYVNSQPQTLDVPAQLINSRTMVPARFISEAMGCEVTWHQETQTAAVADTLKGQHIYVTATGQRYHYSGSCNGGTYYEATLAEAVGRGLTPCDKCVLTAGSVPTAASATVSQKAALDRAKQYLDLMPFSYKGLVEQLEFDKFPHDDAVYAAENCGADWNAQAALKAAKYMDLMSFSKDGLIDQLEFDGFTHGQAVYGVEQNGY